MVFHRQNIDLVFPEPESAKRTTYTIYIAHPSEHNTMQALLSTITFSSHKTNHFYEHLRSISLRYSGACRLEDVICVPTVFGILRSGWGATHAPTKEYSAAKAV